MLAYLIAAVIVLAAVWILVRRLHAFLRTRGESACANCPFSGHCRQAHGTGQDCPAPPRQDRRPRR